MNNLNSKDLTYLDRCSYCNHEERYILRSHNVNTNITDEDAVKMAMRSVGDTEGKYCETCKLVTVHTTVAYDLGDIL